MCVGRLIFTYEKILICIAQIILVIIVLFTKLFYWHRSVILHLGAGLRYGSLRIFRPKQKISYKDIRYGSDDFSVIDHADNNLANGFLGFLVLAIILLLIAN